MAPTQYRRVGKEQNGNGHKGCPGGAEDHPEGFAHERIAANGLSGGSEHACVQIHKTRGENGQGGKGADLVHFFNEDGLGAIINSSRGIIAAYQQEKYAQFGEQNYADASRAAVLDMREDIAQALAAR